MLPLTRCKRSGMILVEIEVAVKVDEGSAHSWSQWFGLHARNQRPDFFQAPSVHPRKFIEMISNVNKGSRFVDEKILKSWPCPESSDCNLERTYLCALSPPSVEWLRRQIRDRIDCWITTAAPGERSCRFSRSSTGCFSRMFVMGRTQFSGLGDTLIGEGAVA
jgi:hypothetical protein